MPSLNKSARVDPRFAAERIQQLHPCRPSLGIVLGSGFNHVLERLDTYARSPYRKLPGFPPVGVSGHAGELLVGRLGNADVIVLSGRCHFYEGHSLDAVTFAIRTLAQYGLRDLLLTNAAGGVNSKFKAGDLMVISDHINLMGVNPLSGPCPQDRSRFVDMSAAYNTELSGLLYRAGKIQRLRLRSGVYLAVPGPSYETPAEVRAFAALGADAVGMSTVPEVIVARQCGLRVAALSCITNLAAGRSPDPLSHAQVLETGRQIGPKAARLIESFCGLYAQAAPIPTLAPSNAMA